jgi:hypothetical protein
MRYVPDILSRFGFSIILDARGISLSDVHIGKGTNGFYFIFLSTVAIGVKELTPAGWCRSLIDG